MQSNNESQQHQNVEQSLAELDAVVATLSQNHDLEKAVQFSLRGLDIRRQLFGLGSPQFETARIKSSQLIIQAAKIELSNDRHKETAELLTHVDKMTEHPLPHPLTALDRTRQVTRLRMMKELMVARFHQGRHRSAITFGKHLLDLAKETLCLYELPNVHLNIASVHGALGQHRDALRHCYVAFQKLCLILEAIETPAAHPFVTNSLALEELDDGGVDRCEVAYEGYCACRELVRNEMSEEVDLLTLAPNFKAPEDGQVVMMSPLRRRWGGLLALAFRSLAAEQEHLLQLDGALLTYKVAHTTAAQCLGADHPVAIQCEQALRDAEQSAKTRSSRVATPIVTRQSSIPNNNSRSATPNTSLRGKTPLTGDRSSASRRYPDNDSTAQLRDRSSPFLSKVVASNRSRNSESVRPPWNEWFNSDMAVPSHHEERYLKELTSRLVGPLDDVSAIDALPPMTNSLNVSAIEVSSAQQEPPYAPHPSKRPNTTTGAPIGRGISPLPPRPATSSFGDDSSLLQLKSKRDRKLLDPIATVAEGACEDVPFEPISLADFSFLQNTYRLRYDINFNRPQSKFGTKPMSSQGARDRREYRSLTAEKRLAEALAAQLGL